MVCFRFLIALVAALILSACSNWSTSNVEPAAAAATSASEKTPVGQIVISESDITDRAYVTLGDIEVTVRKTTIFNSDPTRADVDQRLREEASELGADAVVLARYGTVGVSVVSWGELDGRGRAVRFVE